MNKKTDLPEIQEFLGRYLDAAEKIRSEKDYVASLRSIVENTTTHLSLTAGRNPSRSSDTFEKTMIDIVEEERKLSVKLHELALVQASVINVIRKVSDAKMQKLLYCKYVEGMKMNEISEELDISRPGAYLLFGNALKAAESIYRSQTVLDTFRQD